MQAGLIACDPDMLTAARRAEGRQDAPIATQASGKRQSASRESRFALRSVWNVPSPIFSKATNASSVTQNAAHNAMLNAKAVTAKARLGPLPRKRSAALQNSPAHR